jgi:hypothetical protein
MQAILRGSGPEKRHVSRAAQEGTKMIWGVKHTCPGREVATADEEVVGS